MNLWLHWYRLRYRLRRHRAPITDVYAEMRQSMERLIAETEGRSPNRKAGGGPGPF